MSKDSWKTFSEHTHRHTETHMCLYTPMYRDVCIGICIHTHVNIKWLQGKKYDASLTFKHQQNKVVKTEGGEGKTSY